MEQQTIQTITSKLYNYARERDFSGWDPYDGLNSKLFKATSFNNFKLCRLAWIQFFKRSPINFRPICLVPQGRNPKGIALFASTALHLYKITGNMEYLSDANQLLDWLKINYTKGYSGHAWGYNFPWQARHNLFPAFFPTIVTTSFVGLSFLDGYDAIGDSSLLDTAISASKFILNDLNIHREGSATAYSYGPNDKSRVYNATALAGQLFARLYKTTNDKTFLDAATSAMDFVASHQQKDGSWLYGDHSSQQWIDNFHTGYNLIALKKYQEYTENTKYQKAINNGFAYYEKELFTTEGEPKYYSHSFFPVDIHVCAYAIIMFMEFGKQERAQEIMTWTVKKFLNKKEYFDYQITKWYRNSIPYMRWSQAWILQALTRFVIE